MRIWILKWAQFVEWVFVWMVWIRYKVNFVGAISKYIQIFNVNDLFFSCEMTKTYYSIWAPLAISLQFIIRKGSAIVRLNFETVSINLYTIPKPYAYTTNRFKLKFRFLFRYFIVNKGHLPFQSSIVVPIVAYTYM